MSRGHPRRALGLAALLVVAACARTAGGPEPAAPPRPAPPEQRDEPSASFGPPRPEPAELDVAWARKLGPVRVESANTGEKADVRLYAPDGSVDPLAVEAFSRVAADSSGPLVLSQRLVQLSVKAAHHFGAATLVIISGYRKPRGRQAGDHHSRGEAVDFRLPGVDYRQLAAYLRSLPRAGVGVYTDPRTHYVHLDVRDRSFHWLDASPPGVTWREAPLADARQAIRDTAYTTESDLPLDAR